MGVQALEVGGRARAADADVELGPQLPLQTVGAGEALPELGLGGGRARPALDAAARLEARQGGHEPGAGQVVGGREGLAVVPEGLDFSETIEFAAP